MRAVVLAWCWFAALLTGDVAAAHDLPGNARIVEYDSPAAGLRLKYTNVRFWPIAARCHKRRSSMGDCPV